MTLHPFLPPLLGGALIGLAASVLLVANGRVAGISGIVGELLVPGDRDHRWRWAFLAGMVAASLALTRLLPDAVAAHPDRSMPLIVVAGLLVGFGTRMGNGCTSGHGVCGVSRGTSRSLLATAVFIGAGMFTVAAIRAVGGAL